MTEVETIKEVLAWINKRIAELPEGDWTYYKELKESFEWELKTAIERESENK